MAFKLPALAPLASGWMSNDTFWPSAREFMPAASRAEAWTNTSLPPPSGAINPKPLDVLKNLTVPVGMTTPSASSFLQAIAWRCEEYDQVWSIGCLGQAHTGVWRVNYAHHLTKHRRNPFCTPFVPL